MPSFFTLAAVCVFGAGRARGAGFLGATFAFGAGAGLDKFTVARPNTGFAAGFLAAGVGAGAFGLVVPPPKKEKEFAFFGAGAGVGDNFLASF